LDKSCLSHSVRFEGKHLDLIRSRFPGFSLGINPDWAHCTINLSRLLRPLCAQHLLFGHTLLLQTIDTFPEMLLVLNRYKSQATKISVEHSHTSATWNDRPRGLEASTTPQLKLAEVHRFIRRSTAHHWHLTYPFVSYCLGCSIRG
jgi:hypothetical protein